MSAQLDLFNDDRACQHAYGFITMACVPPGYFCGSCQSLVWQYVPPASNDPELTGYQTADWAWRYVHGRPWTSI